MKVNKKNLIIMAVCGIAFFAVTMPFRKLFALMPVTEVRPASVIPPVAGLLFGGVGAFGAALGNLAADILSGYSLPLCITGFVPQFLYGYLPHVLWKKWVKYEDDGHRRSPVRLDCTANVIKYIVIVFVDSLMVAGMLGGLMQIFGIEDLFSSATLLMLLNNFDFCIVIGIPVLIMTFRHKEGFSLNERTILIFLMLDMVVACLTGTSAFLEAKRSQTDIMELWNRVYGYVAVSLNLLLGISLLFLWYMERNITVPVERLSLMASNYLNESKNAPDSKGFAGLCQEYTGLNSEVGSLARSFNKMLQDLDSYVENLKTVTAEKERIGAELSVATKIQASMLPCIFPAFPERKEFDVYATMVPAKEVGGDFYDFFLVDQDHLAVVIGDVSGKGVPAALFMVIAKTLIMNYAQSGITPAEVFTNSNRQLCISNEGELFVTAWMGVLTMSTGEFNYVNAGHNPPLIRRANGQFEYLRGRSGFVLAGMEGMKYKQASLTLEKDDILYLYTDGVTEATDIHNELYGEERLQQKLNEISTLPTGEILHCVKDDIDIFVKGAPQFDDITMLILKVNEITGTDTKEEKV